MAKKIKTQKPKGGAKPSGNRGASSGKKGGGDAKGRKALKGMLIGAVLIALVAAFFVVPIKGKSGFDHVRGLFGSTDAADGKDGKDAKPDAKPQGRNDPRGKPGFLHNLPDDGAPAPKLHPKAERRVVAKPAGITVAQNVARHAPLDHTTADDDLALDRLVRRHAKHP